MKSYFTIVMVFFVFVLTSCKKDSSQSEAVTDFSKIKSTDWRSNIGKEFEVEGIVVDEGNGHPVLYSDENDYLINTVTPEARYLSLNIAGSSYHDLKEFFGYRVKFTGSLETTDDASTIGVSGLLGDESQARLRISTGITKSSPTQYLRDPSSVDLCSEYPWSCVSFRFGPSTPNKYALLYSGGCDANQAAIRFWNDIGATYKMLLSKGYSPDNIIVVYKDGNPDQGYASYNDVPVNFPGTSAGFQSAINSLKNRMTAVDTFLLAISNHGGGNNMFNAGAGNSGAFDSDKDDNRGTINDNTDETICYYGESKDCTDDDLKKYVDQLQFGCMIGLLAPCYSGGLIYDLRGPKRILISSATEFQYSWGTPTIDIFFATFLNSVKFEAMSPDPYDFNKDGKRTINETFLGMVAGTIQNGNKQQPQYCDDGTGVYTATPSASGYGSTIEW